MKVVGTMRGLIPRDQLQVGILLHETADGMVVTSEWRLLAEGPNGEFVKRDAHQLVYASPGAQAGARAQGLGPVVETARGLIPRDQLQVAVLLFENPNSLEVVTEWRVKAEGPDASHVRRDCMGCFLATPEVQLQAAQFGVQALPSPAGKDVTVGLNGQAVGVEQANIG
jgi:hypothetical protein